MGIYINKGNEGFISALNSEYVDKTGLIEIINKTLNTERRLTCVTRSRRFGKSMAADMLCAYYDKSCDSRHLFEGLAIAQPDKVVNGKMEDKQYEKHLNKYPVLKLDITNFTTKYKDDPRIISLLQQDVMEELIGVYPDITLAERDDLMDVLIKISAQTSEKFICIIDEWDAVLREYSDNRKIEDDFIQLLRRLFKGDESKKVFAGVYMTGILPIKKYKTQSALNNFEEYSVIKPGKMASFFGFTPTEVQALAEREGANLDELKMWYDGYQIGTEPSIYNPYSVVRAIANGECYSYWSATSTYDNVVTYIKMNYDGLKDDIIKMITGGSCKVNTTKFQNDLTIINSKDDVLTVLIHLGYLSYDRSKGECYIPNMEVRMEMTNAVEDTGWKRLTDALAASERLLEDTIAGDEEEVARGIDMAHDANTSILSYNDENSLACVITVAYYKAMNDYVIHRELASGKGFADLVFIPRRHTDKPAMVVELKYNKETDSAIDQIKQKNYPAKVAEYLDDKLAKGTSGKLLLVGINYDRESKKHTCKIEQLAL